MHLLQQYHGSGVRKDAATQVVLTAAANDPLAGVAGIGRALVAVAVAAAAAAAAASVAVAHPRSLPPPPTSTRFAAAGLLVLSDGW